MSAYARHKRHFKGSKRARRFAAWVLVAVAAGAIVYLGTTGRTNSWAETACTVSSSRVVRTNVPIGRFGEPVVMYKGEYQLCYRVNGRDYFIWVNSGWLDADRVFVENHVSSYDPDRCDYRVRYNPANPTEAFAKADE